MSPPGRRSPARTTRKRAASLNPGSWATFISPTPAPAAGHSQCEHSADLGGRAPNDAQPFPCPVDPLLPARRGPAPVGVEDGDPEDATSRGQEGLGPRSPHPLPSTCAPPKPAESQRPVSSALGPQGPGPRPTRGRRPRRDRRGDARQKAAEEAGQSAPQTSTRTRPAGAERRMATLAPAWRCCPLLLLPTAERPALPSRRPAAEGANAATLPAAPPSPRPYNPPAAGACPGSPAPARLPGRTRLSSRARPARTQGLARRSPLAPGDSRGSDGTGQHGDLAQGARAFGPALRGLSP